METFFYKEAFHAMRVKKIRHKNSFRDNAAGGALACRANQAYGTSARNVSINLAEFPRDRLLAGQAVASRHDQDPWLVVGSATTG
jgi:hypothetical protein